MDVECIGHFKICIVRDGGEADDPRGETRRIESRYQGAHALTLNF